VASKEEGKANGNEAANTVLAFMHHVNQCQDQL